MDGGVALIAEDRSTLVPDYDRKLREIHAILEKLEPDETAVSQDKVDVHLSPRIGNC